MMTASASSSTRRSCTMMRADVVADLDLHERVDAVRGELAADPGRVRVDDLPEQQLGADRDDVTAQVGRIRS